MHQSLTKANDSDEIIGIVTHLIDNCQQHLRERAAAHLSTCPYSSHQHIPWNYMEFNTVQYYAKAIDRGSYPPPPTYLTSQ